MKTILLEIFTPNKKYFCGEIKEISFFNGKYVLGITPNHAPIISKVDICQLKITMANDMVCNYAISGGVLSLENKTITLLADSIEKSDEIDLSRALEAKKRAMERLANKNMYDEKRANLALLRAINRISVFNKNN